MAMSPKEKKQAIVLGILLAVAAPVVGMRLLGDDSPQANTTANSAAAATNPEPAAAGAGATSGAAAMPSAPAITAPAKPGEDFSWADPVSAKYVVRNLGLGADQDPLKEFKGDRRTNPNAPKLTVKAVFGSREMRVEFYELPKRYEVGALLVIGGQTFTIIEIKPPWNVTLRDQAGLKHKITRPVPGTER